MLRVWDARKLGSGDDALHTFSVHIVDRDPS
jgi:hypothetical protein